MTLRSAVAGMLVAGVLWGLAGCTPAEDPAADIGGAAGEHDASSADGAANPTDESERPQGVAVSASPLAGTEWQLVELQSMDDSVGTTRPEDPSLYAMRLNRDGTASLRLNCNRGTATWSAEAASDESGTFRFGPMAMTRALCPEGSLDERVVRDAQYVRSYLLREGRLYLSLMADGGIQVWEPVE